MRIEKHSRCDSLELRSVEASSFTMLMRTAGGCWTGCVSIDKSLTALPVLMLWHLFRVSTAADLPGFCICGLSWGQLWTCTGKNSVIKRFWQQFSEPPVLITCLVWLAFPTCLSRKSRTYHRRTLCVPASSLMCFWPDWRSPWRAAASYSSAPAASTCDCGRWDKRGFGLQLPSQYLKAPHKPTDILPHLWTFVWRTVTVRMFYYAFWRPAGVWFSLNVGSRDHCQTLLPLLPSLPTAIIQRGRLFYLRQKQFQK